jgi:low affinity Fe/Cu permease
MFDRFARWCSVWTGRGWYFALYAIGTVLVLAGGLMWGPFMAWMVGWTTALTVTTQLQTILIQNTQNSDTSDMKDELKELGRAVPGAKDVIKE